MNSAQRAPQRFNFAFVGELLAFGNFDEFEHLLHLIERLFEQFDNLRHFINRPVDGGGSGRGFRRRRNRPGGRRAGRRNLFRLPPSASASAAMASSASAAGHARWRGATWFGWLFFRHSRREHGALPAKSNGEV